MISPPKTKKLLATLRFAESRFGPRLAGWTYKPVLVEGASYPQTLVNTNAKTVQVRVTESTNKYPQQATFQLAHEANRCLSDLLFNTKNRVSYWAITRGDLTDMQVEAVVESSREIRNVPLEIEQQAGLSVSQIAARARKHKAALERQGKTLDVIIVDHLGLVQPSSRYAGSRTHEIEETTGALKALAKELNVAVVALCQLNRAVEGREDKRPTMADLRDSGAIEQDADLIIFLFREEYYISRASKTSAEEDRRVARLAEVRNRLDLIIGKARNGPTGAVSVFFDASCNAARDLAEIPR